MSSGNAVLRHAAIFLLASMDMFATTSGFVRTELREAEPPKTIRVIVEFRGTPSVLLPSSKSAEDVSPIFARFRADISGKSTNSMKQSRVVATIHHEYRAALLGAAVEIHPSAIEWLRQLSYVSAVHLDIEIRASAEPTGISHADAVDAET